MGGPSISALSLPSGKTIPLALENVTIEILSHSTGKELSRMITSAALEAEQDRADRLLARKLKRKMADIESGKTQPLTLAQTLTKYGL